MTPDTNLVVSIIVPARNEEACLAACLESLVAQTGIAHEIIVVDDDSTDRTAEIARSFPGVELIPAGSLPDNWTGKNNAMSAGAKAAHPKTKWLLFTDADTVHQSGSLARAVAEAEQHGAALLSYSPAQEVDGFWEKAVMPVIFAELATTYPPQAVNDPASPIAAANGQYLIFSRYAPDAVRTRMYRTFAQLREGWTKNLALLFPRPRALAILRMAEFLLIVGNLSVAVWAKFDGRPNLTLQTALLTVILSGWFAMRIRKAHFSLGSSFTAILGLPMFSYLLVRSVRLRNAGVICEGRTYQPDADETSLKHHRLGATSDRSRALD